MRWLRVTEIDGKWVLVQGQAGRWLQGYRIPAQRARASKGWLVRSEHLPDLLAIADHDGVRVTLVQTDE